MSCGMMEVEGFGIEGWWQRGAVSKMTGRKPIAKVAKVYRNQESKKKQGSQHDANPQTRSTELAAEKMTFHRKSPVPPQPGNTYIQKSALNERTRKSLRQNSAQLPTIQVDL